MGTGRHDLVRAVLASAGYGMRQMLEIEETQRGSEVGGVSIVGGGDRLARIRAGGADRRTRPGERRYRIFKRLYLALRELFCDLRDGARDRARDPSEEQGSMEA